MSLATRFDLTRDEIVNRFRDRIAAGDRTKLTREERDTLALLFVDQLAALQEQGKDTCERVEEICRAERSLLEEGYPTGSINSVYLPAYTRLVKEAIADGRLKLTEQNSYSKAWTKFDGSGSGMTQTHYALDFLTYDLQTQVGLRKVTTAKNNDRQDDLKPVRLESYLAKVNALMESDEPELLAIVIAALTGRRHAEVVSVGRFAETEHPYLVRFEGQQKKSEKTEAMGFEILSLVPGKELLPLVERFRSLLGVKELAGLDDDHPDVQAFNSRVNRRVQSIFGVSGLVPVLSGFKTVSIHRLRALYGAISVHFFCANNQHLHRFLQNHLGHVLTSEVGVANSRATDHYFHYFLVREDGTPITARGVKLMANGLLPETRVKETTTYYVVSGGAVEEEKEVIEERVEAAVRKQRERSSLRIYQDLHDRFAALLGAICPDCKTQQERTEALLMWAEERIDMGPLEKVAEPEPVMMQTVNDQARAIAFFTGEVQRLQGLVVELEARQPNQDMEGLKTEVEGLRAENIKLKEAERKLGQFKQLLGDGGSQAESMGIEQKDQEVKMTIAPPPKPLNLPKDAKKPKSGGAIDRAKAIFLAVQEWNKLHPETTFALTGSLLKETFGINFGATKEFLETHQNEIWELHQESGVQNDRSHNRQLGQKNTLEEFKQFVKEKM